MGGPRAIFDANFYLNFLLSRDPETSAAGLLFKSAARTEFKLLFPADVAEELTRAKARRPYLATRISRKSLDALFDQLRVFATPLPLLEQEPPAFHATRTMTTSSHWPFSMPRILWSLETGIFSI